MSAFNVSESHIDYIVRAALAWGLTDYAGADLLGRTLWAENARSVAHRYSEEPEPSDYEYRHTSGPAAGFPIREAWIVSACDCLEYQSCEHPGWETSVARAALHAIRHHAATRIPGGLTGAMLDGAPWEITQRSVARAQERGE